MTAPTPESARGSAAPTADVTADDARDAAAILLRLIVRRHVDLHRVSSALCR